MDIKLNLGCGNKKIKNYIGIDIFKTDATDIIANISKLPFKDSSVSEIILDNVIEHIYDIPELLKELYRVCQNNAIIFIRTPHFSSFDSWKDPTHIHHLSYFSFDYFTKKSSANYIGISFKILRRDISFGGLWNLIGKLIFKISPKEYEKRWCFIFRAGTLEIELSVKK